MAFDLSVMTQRLGPLPAWGWVGIASGGIVVWRFVRKRTTAAPDTATGAGAEELDAFTDPYDPTGGSGLYFPPSDIRGPTLSPIDQEAADSGVAIELLDRLDAIEEELNTPPAPAPSLADQLQSYLNLQELTSRILDGAQSLVPAAPAAPTPTTPIAYDPAPAPVAVAAPPPPTAPTFPTPVKGAHVWHGSGPPNDGTIRGLVLARYGRAVPTRTTRPGGGGYLVVIA